MESKNKMDLKKLSIFQVSFTLTYRTKVGLILS